MIQTFSLTPYELAGMTGFALYVLNYSLLTLRRISGDSIGYFAINFSAASLVMIGLMASFNLAAALIQGFFITMSVIGISLRLHRRRAAARAARGVANIAARPMPAIPRLTIVHSPVAPFQSVQHWADASPGTGSPDRECA